MHTSHIGMVPENRQSHREQVKIYPCWLASRHFILKRMTQNFVMPSGDMGDMALSHTFFFFKWLSSAHVVELNVIKHEWTEWRLLRHQYLQVLPLTAAWQKEKYTIISAKLFMSLVKFISPACKPKSYISSHFWCYNNSKKANNTIKRLKALFFLVTSG